MNTSDSKYKAIAALEQFIREGRPVKFPVKGTSMLPFIVGGRDCVEFYPVEGELKVGDIVMARVEEGYPVLRSIACARMSLRRRMLLSDPMAAVRVSSRRKRSETEHRWQRLRPVRRVLLKIIKLYILLSYKN